ncbi:MAG: hypothetical protein ABI407_15690, partial [Bradyrhizobium sp.]
GIFLQAGLDMVFSDLPVGQITLVIPGRAEREPGIHNHRCLLSTARRPRFRATSTFVVMDSGPAPSGASRNDEGWQLSRWRTTSISLQARSTVCSTELQIDIGGYGFRACAKRRIPE